MKQYIFKSLIIAAAVTALASCDENSWNDKLDGFEAPTITDVQTIEYTLTSTDYATLAANSTNKTLAGDDLASALKLVGTQRYFTDEIQPRDYIPALLNDSSFPYFTLSDGSSIKVTYNIATDLPAEISAIAAAEQYTVDVDDYKYIWGSEDNYAESFAPSHTAAKSIPTLLKEQYPDAEAGQYVIVNYNTSSVDPVFSATEEPAESAFELSDVISTLSSGDSCEFNGVVMAYCTCGFVVADKSGSIFVYLGSGYSNTYPIGTQIKLSGTVAAYSTCLQVKNSTIEVVGTQAVTYPTPANFGLDEMLAASSRSGNFFTQYVTLTADVEVVEGSSYNSYYFDLGENDDNIKATTYYVPSEFESQFKNGTRQTITGYLSFINKSKQPQIIVTSVGDAKSSAPRRVASVASTSENAVYYFNGSNWSVASSTVILNPADYTAMGQSYSNLSGTLPAQYLPIYLKANYPYAAADDAKFVVYKYYNGSSTSYACDQYVYDGSAWVLNNGVETETSQFVKISGSWIYSPDVTITLPAGKNQEMSTKYYQACVDWVYEHVDVPLGSTGIKTGFGYVTSYGNNEYYSGTSAYQGNVDLRPASARAQYAAGYEGLTDDEVVALMKDRFCNEVMPGALSTLHPDATPITGIDVIYTVNFAAYNGSATSTYVAHFKVVGKAQFEFVDCDW